MVHPHRQVISVNDPGDQVADQTRTQAQSRRRALGRVEGLTERYKKKKKKSPEGQCVWSLLICLGCPASGSVPFILAGKDPLPCLGLVASPVVEEPGEAADRFPLTKSHGYNTLCRYAVR